MTECAICEHADRHASWPAGHAGTHCRRCHQSWAGSRLAHCAVCCQTFTSDSVAELHWRRGRHIDPAEVKGLYLGPDGTWSPSPDRDPAAVAARLAAGRAKAAAR